MAMNRFNAYNAEARRSQTGTTTEATECQEGPPHPRRVARQLGASFAERRRREQVLTTPTSTYNTLTGKLTLGRGALVYESRSARSIVNRAMKLLSAGTQATQGSRQSSPAWR
jgi:hypothetical protein